MQIFATSSDPITAAQWLDDLRLNKMITESAQVICTVLAQDGIKSLPFKSTHESHPIVKWAGSTHRTLSWLCSHHRALIREWVYRGGNTHASGLTDDVLSHVSPAKLPQTFQNSAKNESLELDFTWVDDVHLAYRMYLTARWLTAIKKPTWKKRSKPSWYEASILDDFQIHMAYINQAKQLIGKDRNGIMPCPRCGGDLKYYSQHHFECTESNECLSWQRISR